MIVDFLGVVSRRPGQLASAPSAPQLASAAAKLYGQALFSSSDDSGLRCLLSGDAGGGEIVEGEFFWRESEPSSLCLLAGDIDQLEGADCRQPAKALHGAWSARGSRIFGGDGGIKGRFSAAIWDPHSRTLSAIRDCIGHEPFYYIHRQDYFAFSSSFKALRELITGTETLDDIGIADYLALTHFDAEHTVLAEIRRLPPAHWLSLNPDFSLRVERYWALSDCAPRSYATAEECYLRFREVVVAAVEAEAKWSSTPGLMLSGGLDSSSVGAAFYQGSTGRTGALKAFGSVPIADGRDESKSPDEVPFMQAFVRHYPQTSLHLEEARGGWTLGDVKESVSQIGFPHRDAMHYKLTAITREAKSAGCDRMITGMGGDFFASSKLPEYFAYQFFLGNLKSLLKQAQLERGRLSAFRLLRLGLGQIVKPLLKPWILRFKPGFQQSLDLGYKPAWLSLRKRFARRSRFNRRARAALYQGTPKILCGSIRDDEALLESGLVTGVLEYYSAFSRAHGIKLCSPLLDQRVIEFTATAPIEFRRFGTGQRSLLRFAFASLLPDEIAFRTSKGAFCPDVMLRSTPEKLEAELESLTSSNALREILDSRRLASSFKASPRKYEESEYFYRVLPIFLAANLRHFLSRP